MIPGSFRPSPYVLARQEAIKEQMAREQAQAGQTPSAAGQIGGLMVGGKIASSMAPEAAALTAPEIISATRVPAAAELAAPEIVSAAHVGGEGATAASAAPLATPATAAIVAALAANNFYEQGGKEVLTGKGSTADYSNAALNLNPLTAPINFGLKTLGMESIGEKLFGGKHEDEIRRDSLRRNLRDLGFLTDGNNVALSDGSLFDIGQDGNASMGVLDPTRDGRELAFYDVNFGADGSISAANDLNPLAQILAGGDDKAANDLAGYLTNAALSGGDAGDNIRGFYERAGLNEREQAIERINQLAGSGALNPWEQVAYHNAINSYFGDDGSGSYDRSKLGQGPSEAHQAIYNQYGRPADEGNLATLEAFNAPTDAIAAALASDPGPSTMPAPSPAPTPTSDVGSYSDLINRYNAALKDPHTYGLKASDLSGLQLPAEYADPSFVVTEDALRGNPELQQFFTQIVGQMNAV